MRLCASPKLAHPFYTLTPKFTFSLKLYYNSLNASMYSAFRRTHTPHPPSSTTRNRPGHARRGALFLVSTFPGDTQQSDRARMGTAVLVHTFLWFGGRPL